MGQYVSSNIVVRVLARVDELRTKEAHHSIWSFTDYYDYCRLSLSRLFPRKDLFIYFIFFSFFVSLFFCENEKHSILNMNGMVTCWITLNLNF